MAVFFDTAMWSASGYPAFQESSIFKQLRFSCDVLDDDDDDRNAQIVGAWLATKFCTAGPDIFQHIIIPPYMHKRLWVHMHRAERAR